MSDGRRSRTGGMGQGIGGSSSQTFQYPGMRTSVRETSLRLSIHDGVFCLPLLDLLSGSLVIFVELSTFLCMYMCTCMSVCVPKPNHKMQTLITNQTSNCEAQLSCITIRAFFFNVVCEMAVVVVNCQAHSAFF